jgi:hypothetical protein
MVIRGGVKPPTFRFSEGLSRPEFLQASGPLAQVSYPFSLSGLIIPVYQACRRMPDCAALSVGFLWASVPHTRTCWILCGCIRTGIGILEAESVRHGRGAGPGRPRPSRSARRRPACRPQRRRSPTVTPFGLLVATRAPSRRFCAPQSRLGHLTVCTQISQFCVRGVGGRRYSM